MQRSILILDRTSDLQAHFGNEARRWSHAFLSDLQELVAQVTGIPARVVSVASFSLIRAEGQLLILSGDVPHLPAARLRDALTLLASRDDLVVGPCDGGKWYLLGIPQPELATKIPIAADSLAPWLEQEPRRIVALPLWFRVTQPADLTALTAALRAMPVTAAPATRRLLGFSEGAIARELGA